MNARILNLIHILLGVMFLTGIGITLSLKGISANLFEILSKDRDTAIVFIVFLVGFLAIVIGFIYDKVSVNSREISLDDKGQSGAVVEGIADTGAQIDYESLKKELDEVIRSEGDNAAKSSRVLSLLCNRLNAGQGILFKVYSDGGMPKLKMFASYAYVKHNDQPEEFAYNDGMVGLAAKEDREIILSDLPKEKIKISSGLGKSAPVALHIVPVRCMNEMKGVLELSFFAPLKIEGQKFLQDNLPKIGTLL